MVLISVDLPEPEGPHTTTTSPFWMVVEQSVSTCTGPYHLETFLSSIIFHSNSCQLPIALRWPWTRPRLPEGQQGPPRSKGSRPPSRGKARSASGGGYLIE
ncbi:MAG: hypothetical protein ACD_23C01297G0001 [uncultured bacterium]|nr:MAG: hypothetical protein ACD_23C01297G0001 [uncultured bacterium]